RRQGRRNGGPSREASGAGGPAQGAVEARALRARNRERSPEGQDGGAGEDHGRAPGQAREDRGADCHAPGRSGSAGEEDGGPKRSARRGGRRRVAEGLSDPSSVPPEEGPSST